MSVNQLLPGLFELIISLEEEGSATQRFLIGLLKILTAEQRHMLTDTICDLNQTAESAIPQNKPYLLKGEKSISEKTFALLKSVKTD